ncbi:MAG: hypothetical protein KDD68_17115 [Bdellovibrionales bacterium]|nr:hypothetical protein [Bdellovibrionales bacterium]
MNNQRIIIGQDRIDNSQDLYEALVELYLGHEETYQVFIHERNLGVLEHLFDQIIMKYGVRPVNFNYSLMMDLHG